MGAEGQAKIEDIFVRTHLLHYRQRAIFRNPVGFVGSERLLKIADIKFREFAGRIVTISLLRVPRPSYDTAQLYAVDSLVMSALQKHVPLSEAAKHSALDEIPLIDDSLANNTLSIAGDASLHNLQPETGLHGKAVLAKVSIDQTSRVTIENFVPEGINIYADWRESPPSKRSR